MAKNYNNARASGGMTRGKIEYLNRSYIVNRIMIIEEIAEPFLESVNEPKAYAQRVAKTGPKSRANVGV